MKKTTIEQSAKRLFEAYFRHCADHDLDELHAIFEEAYKLHERLKFIPGQKKGLHNLDEFQLLKALRNYSVHSGDFFGETYTINPKIISLEFRFYHIKLYQFCLVRKDEVRRAINSEKLLPDPAQEQAKVKAINRQLIPYEGYYDLEPVVFNFIVKVYELLLPLDLTISGEAYASMQHSYEFEARSRISHYIPVTPIPFDNDVLMKSLIPIGSSVNKVKDEFGDIATTGINYTGYKLDQTDRRALYDVDEIMAMNLISNDPNFMELTISLSHHIGAAIILDEEMKNIDVKPFNIKQELSCLQQHAIEIDEKFLPKHNKEVFVLVCVSGNTSHVTPSLIYKEELISYYVHVQMDENQ
jgi:hypothetical protein